MSDKILSEKQINSLKGLGYNDLKTLGFSLMLDNFEGFSRKCDKLGVSGFSPQESKAISSFAQFIGFSINLDGQNYNDYLKYE